MEYQSNFQEIQNPYKFIVENSLSAIYIFQEEKIVFMNKACEDLTGYRQKELLTLNYLNLIHPDDRSWMKAVTDEVLTRDADKVLPQPEFRIIRKDGTVRWVRLIPTLVKFQEKKTVIGHVLDIHSQKKAEERLKESEEKYRVLIENAAEAIIVVKEWNVQYFNPQTLKLSGYSKDEFTSLALDDLIHPEDLKLVKERHKKRMKGKNIDSVYSFRIIQKNRTIKWAEIKAVPIPWEDDVAVLIFLADITLRKETEDALKKSEQTFREVVERATDGIGVIQGKRFMYINEKLTEMHECTAEDMLGDYFFNYVSQEEKEKVIDRNARRMKGEPVPAIYQSEIITKKGKKKPVEFNAGMVTYKGKPANLVIVRDISERKKAEDVLRNFLKEKDVLLREIHHRVKNNMQIMSSLLRLQAAGADDERVKKILQTSRARIYTMALIHEKLYQSKDLASIDMGRYIKVFVPHLFHTYEVKAGKVSLNMKCDNVELDITQAIPCGLIINELVSNSIKHGFPGGRKGEISIGLCKDREKIIFTVKDNGTGLPPDFNIRKCKTMGFQVINDLVAQLKADMNYKQNNGIEFEISFNRSRRP